MMKSAVDLTTELDNLQRFGANFADEADVVIPQAYPELSTQRVLTMGLVRGVPFDDRDAIEATGWDVDVLVQRAAELYLEMIFRDGIYHADPHPGNFLLPDGEHLAILDFGDVGRLSSQRRTQLESLVIAVVSKDVEELTDVILELTSPPPGVDVPKLRSDIDAWMNRYMLAGVAQLDMANIIGSGMALTHTHQLVLPADLALLFRVLLRLQGLGRVVGIEVRVDDLLRPYVEKMASTRLDPRRMARRAARTARSWSHLVADLPDELQAILEQIRTGDLGVDFRIHDADGAVDRVVDGLLASASVLASAQLLSRRAGPSPAGLSVPGLIAAGVGIVTWQRLAARRAGRRTTLSRVRDLASLRNN
jgi:ubiquinone biosynthesis protein